MVRRPLLPLLVVAALACVACSGDDDSAEAPTGTVGTAAPETTTTTDPELTVEEEVEAAYLRSWDVYAEAVLTFDLSQLENSFAGPALDVVRSDVESLRSDNTPARMRVEHDYEIEVTDNVARVIDNYVNHSVLLDGESGEPIEADPNETLRYEYLVQEIEGEWKVVDIVRPS